MSGDELVKFEMTEEVIDGFRQKRQIPAHFYNNRGQILIYQKDDITEHEIESLLKFTKQGIYYRASDAERLGIKAREIPEGLSDTVVLHETMVEDLCNDTVSIYENLKESSLTSLHMKKMRTRIDGLFESFEKQPDALIGLIDVLDLMKGVPQHEVQIAVKRTVIAMAIKTRGMQAQSYKDAHTLHDISTVLMMSALFCDIGFAKMNIPRGQGISPKQFLYIRQHPLMSYLMMAHVDTDPRVKRNILCQHRPLREGVTGNNFPPLGWLTEQIKGYIQRYSSDERKQAIVADMQQQLEMLAVEMPYDEDANILALASEFASLITPVPWREAISPQQAVKMIINNSFFTYTDRIVREFLDYVAISLCDNQQILEGGDFLVLAVRPADHKIYFEACRINYVDRYQSRPTVQRIASVTPVIEKIPRLGIKGFTNIRKARAAHYDLARDSSRNIVFVVDEKSDPKSYAALQEMAGPWP